MSIQCDRCGCQMSSCFEVSETSVMGGNCDTCGDNLCPKCAGDWHEHTCQRCSESTVYDSLADGDGSLWTAWARNKIDEAAVLHALVSQFKKTALESKSILDQWIKELNLEMYGAEIVKSIDLSHRWFLHGTPSHDGDTVPAWFVREDGEQIFEGKLRHPDYRHAMSDEEIDVKTGPDSNGAYGTVPAKLGQASLRSSMATKPQASVNSSQVNAEIDSSLFS